VADFFFLTSEEGEGKKTQNLAITMKFSKGKRGKGGEGGDRGAEVLCIMPYPMRGGEMKKKKNKQKNKEKKKGGRKKRKKMGQNF